MNITREKVNDQLFDIYNDRHKHIFLRGSAGSGKSVMVVQAILMKVLRAENKGLNAIAFRKFSAQVKDSVFNEFLKWIGEWNLYDYFKINRTTSILENRVNGNTIKCSGLDNPEKIKSATAKTGSYAIAWLEEATEFSNSRDITKNDLSQVNLRIRPDKFRPSIYYTFNPVSSAHPLKKVIEDYVGAGQGVEYVSTYLDNKFCPPQYKQDLDFLKDHNPDYYKVYGLGEWGVTTENLVLNHWKRSNISDHEPYEDHFMGIDFGWTKSKFGVVEVFVPRGDYRKPFVRELVYMKNPRMLDIIKALKHHGISPITPIYCDHAEPARIIELRAAGFNAIPCLKDKWAGLQFLNDIDIQISRESLNLIGELETYEWKQKGDILIPKVKEGTDDHLIDAMHYAIFTHYRKNKRYFLYFKDLFSKIEIAKRSLENNADAA